MWKRETPLTFDLTENLKFFKIITILQMNNYAFDSIKYHVLSI